MAIRDMLATDPVAVVTAHRPEFTHHPFFSWQNGSAPKGYFKPGQTGIAAASPLAEFFKENGFLVLQNGASADEVDALNRETAAICRGDRGEIQGIDPTLANTLGDGRLADDEIMRRYLCIHFPHKVSDLMYQTLAHPNTVKVLTQVIGPNVKCMQSMLFVKASGKPGQAWHQDEFYIPTRDRSLLGAWIAMDDATVENGCLWVIPGSHKHGVLWPQHQQRDHRFDCGGEATSFPYSDEDAVPVEVRKGSIVFFNGYLLHRSLPNYAPGGFRRSLVNHYMSAESLLPWHWGDKVSGSIAGLDYRDIVMIAGKDPYAWKGIEQRAGSHVRPSGEGGCGTPEHNTDALKFQNMVLVDEDEHDH